MKTIKDYILTNIKSIMPLWILMALGMLAYAGVIVSLTFDRATIGTDWSMKDNGAKYYLNKVGTQWKHHTAKPFLSNWTKSGGGKSLKFETKPTTNNNVTSQRVEYIIRKGLPFGSWRYVGFQFAMPNQSETPASWTLITQFHQLPQPLAALELVRGESFKLAFKVRNNQYYFINKQAGPKGNSQQVWDKRISKAKWYDIVIGIRPNGSTGNNGQVKIWLDGNLELDWAGNLGVPQQFLGRNWPQKYDLKSGIYRGIQNSRLVLYLDNYKVGGSYAEVAPTP